MEVGPLRESDATLRVPLIPNRVQAAGSLGEDGRSRADRTQGWPRTEHGWTRSASRV